MEFGPENCHQSHGDSNQQALLQTMPERPAVAATYRFAI
jgi:hypothetical protein